MTYMRACMSSKFGQIRPLFTMATDRVIMAKKCHHFFSAVFHPILFILADNNDDMHEQLGNSLKTVQFVLRPFFVPFSYALFRLYHQFSPHVASYFVENR